MPELSCLTGKAAALRFENLDTDQIIPKQFLRGIDKSGLAEGILYDHRFDATGAQRPEFVLNRPEYADTSILIGGANFGCGSSREHAPWALEDWGFRVLIAPSFADIFYNNCFKNGMLPIVLAEEQVDELFRRAAEHSGYELSADLETCTLSDAHGLSIKFEVEPFRRHCLLHGLDDIGLTLEHEDKISAYEHAHGIAV